VDRLEGMCGPGESNSDVILRLIEMEAGRCSWRTAPTVGDAESA
jgi:hypothetical protein